MHGQHDNRWNSPPEVDRETFGRFPKQLCSISIISGILLSSRRQICHFFKRLGHFSRQVKSCQSCLKIKRSSRLKEATKSLATFLANSQKVTKLLKKATKSLATFLG